MSIAATPATQTNGTRFVWMALQAVFGITLASLVGLAIWTVNKIYEHDSRLGPGPQFTDRDAAALEARVEKAMRAELDLPLQRLEIKIEGLREGQISVEKTMGKELDLRLQRLDGRLDALRDGLVKIESALEADRRQTPRTP